MRKNKNLNVRMTEELHNTFYRLAERRGLTMSVIVNELVRDYCNNQPQLDLLQTEPEIKKRKRS